MASPLPASAARCNSPSLSSPSSRLRLSRLNIHIHDYALSPKSSPSEKNLQGGTQPSLLHSISAPDVESGLTGLPGLTADRRRNLNRGLQLIHSGGYAYRAPARLNLIPVVQVSGEIREQKSGI